MAKKIVYTSLVGDLFHFGHLKLLQQAKDLGNYLIVGVLTDEAVVKYKRKPIISFEQRKKIISNIKCVDKVIPQNERDGSINLKKLKCVNILCRGDDIIIESEVETIKKLGGKFVLLKRTPGISTTLLIKKIKNL